MCVLGWVGQRLLESVSLKNDFADWVFDDPFSAEFFEVGDEVACHFVLDDGFDSDPTFF